MFAALINFTQRRPAHRLVTKTRPLLVIGLRVAGLSRRDAEYGSHRLCEVTHRAIDAGFDGFLEAPWGKRIQTAIESQRAMLPEELDILVEVFNL